MLDWRDDPVLRLPLSPPNLRSSLSFFWERNLKEGKDIILSFENIINLLFDCYKLDIAILIFKSEIIWELRHMQTSLLFFKQHWDNCGSRVHVLQVTVLIFIFSKEYMVILSISPMSIKWQMLIPVYFKFLFSDVEIIVLNNIFSILRLHCRPVVQVCNPTYMGIEEGRLKVQGQPWN